MQTLWGGRLREPELPESDLRSGQRHVPALQRDECASVTLQLTMGFFFRRSIKIGPFRLNFSKSGVGASAGVRGLRTGISATGRRTTRVTIPGTGIGYQHTHRQEEGEPRSLPAAQPTHRSAGWLLIVLLVVLFVVAIASV